MSESGCGNGFSSRAWSSLLEMYIIYAYLFIILHVINRYLVSIGNEQVEMTVELLSASGQLRLAV